MKLLMVQFLCLLLLPVPCIHSRPHHSAAAPKKVNIHPPPPPHLLPNPTSLVESSASFSLYYGHNFKVVQNLFYNLTYLLLPQPVDSFGKDWNLNITVFEEPLSNYTIDTSAPVGFLELLGTFDKLKGIAVSSLASPCLLQLVSQGAIPTIDVTDSNSTSSFQALFSSMASVPFGNESNYVSFDSLSDQGPLKRAEWIKFVAAFFDLEARANDVYGQIESNYQCLNGSMKDNSSTPTVAWTNYNGAEGIWALSDAAYKLQLNSDAGGLNIDSSMLPMSFNMSNQSDVNNFYSILSTLQVVIDETYAPDPLIYTIQNFTTAANITNTTEFPFLANGRLWRYDKRVGSYNGLDWLEGAIPQPQIVLRDLMEAFHPTGGYNTTYFRNIGLGENVVNTTDLACTHAVTLALEPTIIPC